MAAVAGPQGHAYEARADVGRAGGRDDAAPGRPFDLVWQSRSGPPSVPWLEPDVNDHLRALAEAGEKAVVVFPVGFVSDHLEVIWDLDNEARRPRPSSGCLRAGGDGGHHPAFVAMCGNCSRNVAGRGGPRLGTNCPAACCFVARRVAASTPDPAERRLGACTRSRWTILVRLRPGPASGVVRRLLDGVVQDEAALVLPRPRAGGSATGAARRSSSATGRGGRAPVGPARGATRRRSPARPAPQRLPPGHAVPLAAPGRQRRPIGHHPAGTPRRRKPSADRQTP